MDFSKLNLNGQEYNVKDEKARQDLSNLYVSNIGELKSLTTLQAGDIVKTLGYYEVNDGGSGIYLIRNKKEEDIEDNGLIHFLENELVAEMIIENDAINILQLGYVANNNSQDIKPAFDLINNLSINKQRPITLNIPCGYWYTSPAKLSHTKGVKIKGFSGKCYVREGYNTVLHTFNENQQYILKVGNDTPYIENEFTRSLNTEDLCFGYEIDNVSFKGNVSEAGLILVGMCYSKIGDLSFREIENGYCMLLTACWENNFGNLYFRNISSVKSCIFFDQIPYGGTYNCSALKFDYCSFEGINGSCIETTDYSFVVTNTFNIIDFEQRWYESGGTSQKPNVNENDIINNYIFKGYFDFTTVNSINVYINEEIYNNIDNKYYRLKAILSDIVNPIRSEQSLLGVRNYLTIGKISLYNEASEFYLAHSVNSQRGVSSVVISSVNIYDNEGGIYDSYDGMCLNIGNITGKNLNVLNTLMNKISIKATTSGTKPNATLTKIDDAIDVSGCVLKINNVGSPGICIKGSKKIKLLCRVANINENELGEDVSSTITLRTYTKNVLGADNKKQTLTASYTGGLEEIVFEGLNIGEDNYITLSTKDNIGTILIYRMDLE